MQYAGDSVTGLPPIQLDLLLPGELCSMNILVAYCFRLNGFIIVHSASARQLIINMG